MTGCLAGSPRLVAMHVCFYSGFDWTSLSGGSRQERGLETGKDPQRWQPGCMFETTSFRSNMISVGCHHNRAMFVHCIVHELISAFVCDGVGGTLFYFPGTWCMHTELTSIPAISRFKRMNGLSHAITWTFPLYICPALSSKQWQKISDQCVNAPWDCALISILPCIWIKVSETPPSLKVMPSLCLLASSLRLGQCCLVFSLRGN